MQQLNYLLIIAYLFSFIQYKIVFGHIIERQLSNDTLFENDEQGIIEEPSKTFYIRYGLLAKPGQFPYVVSLQRYEDEDWKVHFCGGGIISTKFVLSAAHCLCRKYRTEEYFIIAGVVDNESKNRKVFKVQEIICHPKYNANNFHYDIVLVQIKKHFVFSPTIQAIPLVQEDSSKPVSGGLNVTVAGWGRTEDKHDKPYNELRYTHTLTIPNKECQQRMKQIEGIDLYVINSTICSQDPSGSQPARGDSGSPLTYNNQLIGVFSWISGRCCGPETIDGYTSVAHHRSWISRYINSL